MDIIIFYIRFQSFDYLCVLALQVVPKHLNRALEIQEKEDDTVFTGFMQDWALQELPLVKHLGVERRIQALKQIKILNTI